MPAGYRLLGPVTTAEPCRVIGPWLLCGGRAPAMARPAAGGPDPAKFPPHPGNLV
jgi:hypothetical protein